MTLMSATFTLVWIWLAHHSALLHPTAQQRVRTAVNRSAVGPAAYAVSTLLAVVNATLAFALYAAIAGYFALSGRRITPTADTPDPLTC